MTCGVSCSICNEYYTQEDDIYATRCGHVFHYECLTRWLQRSQSNPKCPTCSSPHPQSFKIYLDIEDEEPRGAAAMPNAPQLDDDEDDDDGDVYEQSNQQLQTDDKLRMLHVVQSQLEKAMEENRKLQEKLQETQEIQLNWAKKFSETELHIDVVHNYAHILAQQRDERESELQRTAEVLHQLEAELDKGAAGNPNAGNVMLTTKLTILEKKLQAVSKQLEDEVGSTTKLTLENTKLKHLLTLKNASAAASSAVAALTPNAVQQLPPTPSGEPSENSLPEKVVIKGFPLSVLKDDWKETVLQLAQQLGIDLPLEAILGVHRMGMNATIKNSSFKVHFLVTLANGFVEKFLQSKEKLATLPEYKDLIIEEYKTEPKPSTEPKEPHKSSGFELFQYAKCLRKCGYKAVYVNKGKVIAKKSDDQPSIIIRTKEQVDLMKDNGIAL